MGIMNLFHKKKADDLAFNTAMGNESSTLDPGMPNMNDPMDNGNYKNMQPSNQMGTQQGFESNPYQPSFSQQNQHASFTQDNSFTMTKELEVISSKLDAIKAILDSMNQRISNLERENYNSDNRNQRW